MSRFEQKVIALLVPLALVFAWAGGKARVKETITQKLSNISSDIQGIVKIDEYLYQGNSRENPEETFYFAYDTRPSYGGPLRVAVAVNSKKIIQHVAILDSVDTHSYLEKVVNIGLLDQFTGKSMDQMPEVDGISGATLSSTAIIEGVEGAVQKIKVAKYGVSVTKRQKRGAPLETVKIFLICLFYLAALIITNKKFKLKRKAHTALLILSVITLGFWLGAQFSISTLVTLLSGAWINGMATHAALLCLVLAIVVFLLTKKNLFCSYICPFGALQEGLGSITGCSPPVRKNWMDWIGRGWVFIVLLLALYFQTPADAMYEPFGKVFNFIGSGIIYSLTILIVIASLMVKRPWCNLFCPGKSMFFYLRFARNAFVKKNTRP